MQALPLGTRLRAFDVSYGAGEFIYLKGVTGTAVGSVVLIVPDDWSTTLAAANDVGNLAVAVAAVAANTN